METNLEKNSPHRIEELDTNIAIVQYNIAPDDSQPEDPANNNENQTKPNLETTSVLENDQLGNQKHVQVHTNVHDSLSNTSLSQK